MAFVYLNEHTSARAAALVAPPLVKTRLAIGTSQEVSDAFSDATRIVRVHTDAACHIAIGADPTASSTGWRMSADSERTYAVRPGHRLAVIGTT